MTSWSGLGAIVVGMCRDGYELRLDSDEKNGGWKASFLHRSYVYHPWVGQLLTWWPTPWRAVQDAAWQALDTPVVPDYTVTE